MLEINEYYGRIIQQEIPTPEPQGNFDIFHISELASTLYPAKEIINVEENV